MSQLAEDICRRFDSLKSDRGLHETQWQQIGDHILPRRSEFTTQRTPGDDLMSRVYDETGIHANEMFAAGLVGLMANPSTRWLRLTVADPQLKNDRDVRQFMDDATDTILFELSRPQAGFYTSMHEVALEYGAFGTAPLYVGESSDRSSLMFQSRPLYECLIAQNEDARVDTVLRKFKYTVRQCVLRWGEDKVGNHIGKLWTQKKYDERVEILHAVMPRDTYKGGLGKKNMPIRSCYIDPHDKHVIYEGGFEEMPYVTPRFSVVAGDVYGRGPGHTALPGVKMLQEMEITLLRAGQKAVDPPMFLQSDGATGIASISAGSLNWYNREFRDPFVLNTGANMPLGMEMSESVRNRIRTIFYNDMFDFQESPNMTATEVLERTRRTMRRLGPTFGRIQGELFSPLIDRVFGVLWRAGRLPQPPQALEGQMLTVEYTSPLAMAQKQMESGNLMEVINILSPIIQAQPELLDRLNGDQVMKDTFSDYALPTDWLRGDDDVAEIRSSRQTADDAMMEAEMMDTAGSAAKSMADAGVLEAVAGIKKPMGKAA